MRDEALALVAGIDDPASKLNLLREYIQAFVLRSLHESEAFRSMAFVGGTALRFLENLPRYSEDLDFSVVDEQGYEPRRWLKKIKAELALSGFDCTMRWNEKKTVNAAWLGLSGLLHQVGLATSPLRKLSIKLEIDTRPPAGARLSRSVVRRHLTFVVCHYDQSSLMAGKVHALLARPYPKGRDWFDLVWYRAHRPPIEPNVDLLKNALNQTHGQGRFAAEHWRRHLRDRLEKLEVEALADDVRVFLERSEDRALLTRESLSAALAEP